MVEVPARHRQGPNGGGIQREGVSGEASDEDCDGGEAGGSAERPVPASRLRRDHWSDSWSGGLGGMGGASKHSQAPQEGFLISMVLRTSGPIPAGVLRFLVPVI